MILENGLNLFTGKGKTTFLMNLSKVLYENEKKLVFIGGTNEYYHNTDNDELFLYKIFKFNKSLITNTPREIINNHRSLLKEYNHIINCKSYYDYILIDDIDLIDVNILNRIIKTNKTIIATSKENEKYNGINQINYTLDFDYLYNYSGVAMGNYHNTYLKELYRTVKLNLILT
jgi:hypothetical protein